MGQGRRHLWPGLALILLASLGWFCRAAGFPASEDAGPIPTTAPSETLPPSPTITPELPSPSILTSTPSPPTPTSAPWGRVVGLWGVPLQDLPEVASYGFNTVFYAVRRPEEAVAYLEAAKDVGLRVVLNLLRPEAMMDPDCRAQAPRSRCPFDLGTFAASLKVYRGMGLERYPDTFLAHLLMDEPFDPTNWGGKPIPVEDLRGARERSYALLGPIPTALNAGYIPPAFPPQVADLVMSTFYRNKARRFGSLEAYLDDQLDHLTAARQADPNVRYVVLLQAVGGAAFGSFPTPEEMEEQALTACRREGVDGFFWWTWRKPQVTDFATVLRGPEGEAYRAMIARVRRACAEETSASGGLGR